MEKGQIFSLDFLISMVVVMAAVGLLIQATEFNTYNMKEERIYNEMRNVARISANLIVSSNETTCENITGGEHLMNCIDTTAANFAPIKTFLANSGYEYEIKTSDGALSLSGTGFAWDGQDFVEIKRKTFVNDDLINVEDLTVRVWKE